MTAPIKKTTTEIKRTVTTLEELKQATKGTLVDLPGFDGINKVTFKLQRVPMMHAIAEDNIPNELLPIAIELFDGKQNETKEMTQERVKEMNDFLLFYARACMVEPTFEELEKAGITLTDEQLTEIYRFGREGQQALAGFRSVQERAALDNFIAALSEATVGASKNK